MPFPHRYSVGLSDDRLSAEPRQPIVVGAPPQFGGTNDVEIAASIHGRE